MGTARSDVVALLENGEYDAAADRLRQVSDDDPTGESRALLGLADFHRERYRDAAAHYERALEAADGDRSEWSAMLAACRANAEAEVDVPVPDIVHFDRDTLLARPLAPTLPAPPDDDGGDELDPGRPSAGSIPELRKDPWTGDAAR